MLQKKKKNWNMEVDSNDGSVLAGMQVDLKIRILVKFV